MSPTTHNPQPTTHNPPNNPLKWLINSLAVSTLCLSANVWAGSATWTDVNNGTLDGISFTVTYTNTGQGTSNQDLSGANYSHQPLGATQAVVGTVNKQDITFTFGSAVSNLLLYGLSLQGSSCTGSGVYTFNHAPTIKSGFGSATTSGNDLTVGTSVLGSGIISFTGAISTLTVNPDCTDGGLNGFITLATDDNVPPPSPTGLSATPASETQINLSWTDASADETGFKIFQGGSLIHTTAANATSYNVTGLTCNTGYAFTVAATNANGDSSAAATTPATTTTAACSGGVVPAPISASILDFNQPTVIFSKEISVTE